MTYLFVPFMKNSSGIDTLELGRKPSKRISALVAVVWVNSLWVPPPTYFPCLISCWVTFLLFTLYLKKSILCTACSRRTFDIINCIGAGPDRQWAVFSSDFKKNTGNSNPSWWSRGRNPLACSHRCSCSSMSERMANPLHSVSIFVLTLLPLAQISSGDLIFRLPEANVSMALPHTVFSGVLRGAR